VSGGVLERLLGVVGAELVEIASDPVAVAVWIVGAVIAAVVIERWELM
jgi:uncharacterized protein (DUF697 family)